MAKQFSDNAMSRIAKVVRQVEGQGPPKQKPAPPSGEGWGVEFYIGETDGSGITARSGTTAGSGTVTVYSLVGATITVQQDADGNDVTETCRNLSSDSVGATSYVMMLRDFKGTFWCIWEDC